MPKRRKQYEPQRAQRRMHNAIALSLPLSRWSLRPLWLNSFFVVGSKTAAVFLLVFLACGCAQDPAPIARAPDPAPAAVPQPAPLPKQPKPVVIDLSFY